MYSASHSSSIDYCDLTDRVNKVVSSRTLKPCVEAARLHNMVTSDARSIGKVSYQIPASHTVYDPDATQGLVTLLETAMPYLQQEIKENDYVIYDVSESTCEFTQETTVSIALKVVDSRTLL